MYPFTVSENHPRLHGYLYMQSMLISGKCVSDSEITSSPMLPGSRRIPVNSAAACKFQVLKAVTYIVHIEIVLIITSKNLLLTAERT